MEALSSLGNYLVDRLKEPSTYAGIGLVLASAGIQIPDALGGPLVNLGMGVFGILAFVLKERRHAPAS